MFSRRLCWDRRSEPAKGEGEAEAVTFDALVRLHGAALHRRARRLTGDESEAHDLVQDTLERGMRRLPAGTAAPDACAWLHATMRNLFLDRRRAYEHRYRTHLEDEDLRALPSPEAPSAQAFESPEIEALRSVIAELDPALREVIVLKLDVGLSQLEIAERLQIPPATVGTRVFRAKKKLRALLEARLEQPARRVQSAA